MLRAPVLVCAALLALLPALGAQAATASAQGERAVTLAFWPQPEADARDEAADADGAPGVLTALDERRALSLGLTGATQGRYDPAQALLDLSARARAPRSPPTTPDDPPELAFYADGRRRPLPGLAGRPRAGGDARPPTSSPACSARRSPAAPPTPGSAARSQLEAVAAADRAGRVPIVSLGSAATVAARARALLGPRAARRRRPADRPDGRRGARRADRRAARRRAAARHAVAARACVRLSCCPAARWGCPAVPAALMSATTRLDGVVAAIDYLPTVLRWLGEPVPDEVKGQPIRVEGARDAGRLERLEDRLRVVGPRRFPALETVLAAWLALVLLLGILADRRGVRAVAADRRPGDAVAARPVLLVTAAVQPARTVELAMLAGGGLLLGALTDRLRALAARPGRARPADRGRLRGRPRAGLGPHHPLAAGPEPAARARATTASATSWRPRSPCCCSSGWRRC